MEDDSINENELTGLKHRFSVEGIDWEELNWNGKTLYVWRWLVDADANLKASRHITDKLRRHHDEEKQQLSAYSDHLRTKCEERVESLEVEVQELKEDLKALLNGTQAVGTMMLQEGLDDIAQTSLGEQIAYLLVERSKLSEELQAARTNPRSDREKELTTQLIKVSTEKELLNRSGTESNCELNEMKDRVRLLERATHQLEADNETLVYKLSEALAEIEDGESKLRRHMKGCNGTIVHAPSDSSLHQCNRFGPNSLHSLPFIQTSKNNIPSFDQEVDGAGSLPYNDQQNINNVIKTNNTSNVFPNNLHNLQDGQLILSKSQISHAEEVNNLKLQLHKLQNQLLEAGDKMELIVRKYELYKIKSKNKLETIGIHQKAEIEQLHRRIHQLESEVQLHLDQLKEEEALRGQLEDDLKDVRIHRQKMFIRMSKCEQQYRDSEQEVAALREKLKCRQETNVQFSPDVQNRSS